jgi:Polyketide cyclase / dehydrase and lipid transport
MREYEQTRTIDAPADEAFAWLSEVSNLPKYLPPVVDVSIEGPSAGDNPGRRVRATLEYPGEGGGTFAAEGYLAVDEGRRRIEWGAEVERDYSGWLEVAGGGDGESRVMVHLNFGGRSVESGLREQSPEDRDPLAEGLAATLESISRQIEEGSGKVEAPAPGVELPTGENPAVIDPPETAPR